MIRRRRSARLAGAVSGLFALFVLVAGCGRSRSDAPGEAASAASGGGSGGAAGSTGAGGSGGTLGGTGVTGGTATGGTATGGTATGGTATGGRAAGGTGNFANAAGWGPTFEVAPVAGPHDLVELDCGSEPIPQDFLVQPTLSCWAAPDFDAETNRQVTCEVLEYCMNQADCTREPFGKCEGSPAAGCDYPDEPCHADADCVSLPDGYCPELLDDTYCDTLGNCWPFQQRCEYPSNGTPCDVDADCSDRPGGSCRKVVLFPRCVYSSCGSDSDCESAERCTCSNDVNSCVPADCFSDAECPSGETCREQGNCRGAATAFHCTTPDDTCATNDDCSSSSYRCEFITGRWQCNSELCPLD